VRRITNREQRREHRHWFNEGRKHGLENRISDLDYLLNNILSDRQNNLSCLDIGCAEGDMLGYFSTRFSRVVGIEKYDSLYHAAVEKFENIENVEIIHGDILLDDIEEFDFTFCLGILHYFELESERLNILRKVLGKTRAFSFFRTAFYENKLFSENNSPKVLRKATKIETISQAAWECGFRWIFLDNTYRGQGDRRLGDLVIFQKITGNGMNLDSILFTRQ
jgi:hypothetical protein